MRAGHAAGDATLVRLAATLQAAATADEATRNALAEGRLAGDLDLAGFGFPLEDAVPAEAAAVQPAAAPPPAAPPVTGSPWPGSRPGARPAYAARGGNQTPTASLLSVLIGSRRSRSQREVRWPTGGGGGDYRVGVGWLGALPRLDRASSHERQPGTRSPAADEEARLA